MIAFIVHGVMRAPVLEVSSIGSMENVNVNNKILFIYLDSIHTSKHDAGFLKSGGKGFLVLEQEPEAQGFPDSLKYFISQRLVKL